MRRPPTWWTDPRGQGSRHYPGMMMQNDASGFMRFAFGEKWMASTRVYDARACCVWCKWGFMMRSALISLLVGVLQRGAL